MAHSAEDIYLMVMTGGYRAKDIERWAEEIIEEAIEDARGDIEKEGYNKAFEEGYNEGEEAGWNNAITEAKAAVKYLER